MEQKQSDRKPKKKRYDWGLVFKAKHMGIAYDTLYRYRTNRQPKPANYLERYLPACAAWDRFAFIAKCMGIGTTSLSCYLHGTKPKPANFDENYEAACKQCEEHFSTLGKNQ